jgi:hypothetical protein
VETLEEEEEEKLESEEKKYKRQKKKYKIKRLAKGNGSKGSFNDLKHGLYERSVC